MIAGLKRAARVGALAFALWSIPPIANAQTPIISGEREAFAGGTGIGRLGSTGAAYYNPAALASLDGTRLAASGTLFRNNTQELSGALSTRNESFQSVPTQVSSVWRRGEWRSAMSVFTTYSFDGAMDANLDISAIIPGTAITNVPTHLKISGTILLIGPSLARPVGPNWLAGLSLFVAKSDQYSSTVMRLDSKNGVEENHSLAYTEDIKSSYTLVPVIGTAWKARPDLNVGFRFRGPSVPLTGKQTYSFQQSGYRIDGGGVYHDAGAPQTTRKFGYRDGYAMQLGTGAAWSFGESSRLHADAQWTLKQTFRTGGNDYEKKYGDALAFAVGYEFGKADRTWSFGAFHNQNADSTGTGNVKSYMGATAGVVTAIDHIESGAGVTYIFGESRPGGTITTRETSLGFLLSTTYKF